MTPDESGISLLEQLIEASYFALDDLDENRSGYLSAFQKFRLNLLVSAHFCAAVLCFGLALGAAWLYLKLPLRFPLAACLVWSIGPSLLGIVWIRNSLPLLKDLRAGKVLTLQGDVQYLYRTFYGKGQGYYMPYRIAGMLFEMAWVVLPVGQTCQVYYTPSSRIIVSIEPV